MRVELPRKVNGTAQYAIDVQVPGMLYGAILRAPSKARARPDRRCQGKGDRGVVQIVPLPYGVGVIAQTPWAAFDAKSVLDVTWNADRQGLGLQQREGAGRIRRRGARHVPADQAVGQGG